MSKLSDVTNAVLLSLMANISTVKPVLAINAGGATTVKTTSAISFTVNGVQYSKTALAAQSIAVTHTDSGRVVGGAYVQPAPVAPATSVTVYYTLGVNAAGTICVVQGTYAGQNLSQSQMGVSAVGDGSMPDVPSGYTAFGIIKVVTASTATFTPGTTALDAANVTATYFDIAVMPAGLL